MLVIFLMNVTILPAPSIVIRLTNVDCAFKEMECEIVKLEEDNRELVLSIRKHEESQASNSSSWKRYRTSLKHLKVRLSSWRKKTKSWYSLSSSMKNPKPDFILLSKLFRTNLKH
ncbi:hypothetical protein Tco_1431922 [Tanacetum coccineum]